MDFPTRIHTGRRGAKAAGGLALMAMVATGCAGTGSGPSGSALPGPPPGAGQLALQAGDAFARLPIRFEANAGQTDPSVDFVARGSGYNLFLTAGEAVFSMGAEKEEAGGAPGGAVRMRLLGADAGATAEAGARLPGVTNYIRSDPARSVTNVAGHAGVTYRGVYPGVDLTYYGVDTTTKYDFVVAPGADPAAIALAFTPAKGVTVAPSGDLVVTTESGELRQKRPFVYQDTPSGRSEVTSRFVVDGGGRVSFDVGSYDRSRALVIDPAMAYSSLIGGVAADSANAVAVDSTGSAYLTGSTAAVDFPVTAGALQTTKAAGTTNDAFVVKLNPAGSALVYATYLGGGLADAGNGIAVDGTGAAHVVGSTISTDFPVTPLTAPQAAKAAGATNDVFATKLNPDGSALVFSTYLGGASADSGTDIAIDGTGAAYVSGTTASTAFPVTAGAYQTALSGGTLADAFVTKLNPAGVDPAATLVYSTFLGGSAAESGGGIAVDSSGRAHVTGQTSSTTPTPFPTTTGAFQPARAGTSADAFVTRLNAAGTALEYSSYLGGTTSTFANAVPPAPTDTGSDIAVDATGNAYVVGTALTDDFPTTAGAFQTTRQGEGDAFVAKLNPAGTGAADLVWSTYVGGASGDNGNSIAVDGSGVVTVAGSTAGGFPTLDPVALRGGNGEAFVTRLNASGTGLVWSTHLGGAASESGLGVAVDSAGAAYVVGNSIYFAPGDFPDVNPFQPDGTPGSNGFVAKIAPTAGGLPLVTSLQSRTGSAAGGTTVRITGRNLTAATAVSFGATAAGGFTVDSATQITAVSPAHAKGSVVVTVTTPTGTSPANPAGRFDYAEGTFEATGSLATSRWAQTATLLADGKVLVTGGRASVGGDALTSAELYDPLTGTWSPAGNMSASRFTHTATLLANGKVLVVGGFGGAGVSTANAQPVQSSADLYDPATNTWAPTSPTGTRRALHQAIRLPSGQVLVAGGRTCDGAPPTACNSTFTTNTAELYDPATGTWTPTGSMALTRHTAQAALVAGDTKVLIPGGFPGATSDLSGEVYDIAAGTWSMTGPLNSNRARAGATPLRSGKVLAGPGFPNTNTAELYDPATNTFSFTGNLVSSSRFNAGFVLLPNGNVMAEGGGNGGVTVELYNPATNTWRVGGIMTTARGSSSSNSNNATAVVLSSNPDKLERNAAVCGANCGKVLLVGDSDDTAVELYTPAPANRLVDLDGDTDTDVAVYRPGTGAWYPQGGTATVWGAAGDVPVPGDYDGDGVTDVAVYRPSTGDWFVQGGLATVWGAGSDVPVPGDYDGDGVTDVAVYRPSTGQWFVQGGATTVWGASGDVPVPGDYDGDGTTDIAVFRPSTGTWFVHGGVTTVWGAAGDVPVPGDYDGNGSTDVAVYRPSTGHWFVQGGLTTVWGAGGDVPEPADYDGDGTTDVAVYRPSTNTWFVQGGVTTVWGAGGDVPLSLPLAIRSVFFP